MPVSTRESELNAVPGARVGAVFAATPHAGPAELLAKPRFPAGGFKRNGGYFSPTEIPFQKRPFRTKEMDPWGLCARIGDPGAV